MNNVLVAEHFWSHYHTFIQVKEAISRLNTCLSPCAVFFLFFNYIFFHLKKSHPSELAYIDILNTLNTKFLFLLLHYCIFNPPQLAQTNTD